VSAFCAGGSATVKTTYFVDTINISSPRRTLQLRRHGMEKIKAPLNVKKKPTERYRTQNCTIY